jgi:hypothetical protein
MGGRRDPAAPAASAMPRPDHALAEPAATRAPALACALEAWEAAAHCGWQAQGTPAGVGRGESALRSMFKSHYAQLR